MSVIYELKEGASEPTEVARYSLSPKDALVCFIKQSIEGNFNSWEYPKILRGMWESKAVKNHWYFETKDSVIAAYPA